MADDLMLQHACKSYRLGEMVCADGFPQNGACNPRPCHDCGKWGDKLPNCQRENLSAPFINPDTGAPALYRGNVYG